MKNKFSKTLPLVLAGALQVMPMLRTVLPMQTQGLAPSTWAIVLKLATGAVAILGFHGISSASSIAISPANATNGQPYIGTITYSGTHAGSVSSMKLTNTCLGSAALAPGLTIVYSSVNKATVSGTPTTPGNFPFQLRVYDGSCGSGDTDARSTTLAIGGTTGSPPSFSSPPESGVAQIGSDVLMSAVASGTPAPSYRWYIGVPSPATLVSTNSTLSFTNVQFASAGLYTCVASNASGVTPNSAGQAFLSICQTPGSDILAFHHTNYAIVSNAITMTSYITNAPSGSNVYKWQYQYVDITAFSTNGNNLSLSANQIFAGHSGTYSVVFNGTVGATTVVNQQLYDSYWAFGTRPVISTPPQSTNGPAGTNLTLTATAYVLRTPYTNHATLFQWYHNDTDLVASEMVTGTVSTVTESGTKVYLNSNVVSSLPLINISASDAGSYTVVASNYWGSVTSSPAILTVTSSSTPPGISSQPVPRSVLVGQTATFAVTATGTEPLTYQWKKNSVDLSNDSVYSGVNTNLLTLTGVGANHAGNYSVAITNEAGFTNSSSATLTVAVPPKLSLGLNGGNTVLLTASTLTGLNYVVETATNLASPTFWLPVATNVVQPSGVVLFTNTTANPIQFFRLSFP